METIDQSKRIYTKLKFVKSKETKAYISFVSQHPRTGYIAGVRQDSKYPKKIVIIDKKLAGIIVAGVLYNATIIPMKEKDGYIAIKAEPMMFKATVATSYNFRSIYKVEVNFGNKTILFDPIEGKRDSVRTLAGVIEVLEKRVDIENLQQVIEDFTEHTEALIKQYKNDGMPIIYPRRKPLFL
jgi:hypothetical protein